MNDCTCLYQGKNWQTLKTFNFNNNSLLFTLYSLPTVLFACFVYWLTISYWLLNIYKKVTSTLAHKVFVHQLQVAFLKKTKCWCQKIHQQTITQVCDMFASRTYSVLLMRQGRQLCGIFHYHSWTASSNPRLLFSHAGFASWGLSIFTV